MNAPPPRPRPRWLRRILLFALLHYGVLLALQLVIFLTSHIPPKAVNLDPLIIALVSVENVLVAPRKFLLWVWPWEMTPPGLGWFLAAINSLAWGAASAALASAWRRVTT